VDLKKLRTAQGEEVSPWTGFWGKAGGVLVLLIGIAIAIVAVSAVVDSVQ
jgi:hypothetical protein